MYVLLTFIIVWAISPGPVLVMTLQDVRKYGVKSGVALASGATVTSILMVVAALLVQQTRFTAILESQGLTWVEQIGAIAIISLGLLAGYRAVFGSGTQESSALNHRGSRTGFIKGLTLMATYIPQSLLFYNVIVPQTVTPEAVVSTIAMLGALKVVLIFAWHAGAASLVGRAQRLLDSPRFGKVFELAAAGLIMMMGLNILF